MFSIAYSCGIIVVYIHWKGLLGRKIDEFYYVGRLLFELKYCSIDINKFSCYSMKLTTGEEWLFFTNASCRGLITIRVTASAKRKEYPMDQIMGIIGSLAWLLVIFVVILGLFGAYMFVKVRYKKVGGNEVLVISGTKKGVRVYPGGGKFVSPFETSAKFSTAVLDLNGDGKEAPTHPKVLVVVDWNAQVRPDSSSHNQLIRAYRDYYGDYKPGEITKSLQNVLEGELRNVIGEMTPEELRHKKEEFNSRVTEGASERMKALGFELVNLNLSDVTDKNGYFNDTAATELEDKRQIAANIRAEAARNIAVVQAKATQESRAAEITSQLAIDENERDAAIERASYKAQRDVAEADANVAGSLRSSERAREVAANEGAVAVVRAEQEQKAANAQRAAQLTRAETDRQRAVIEASADKERAEIEAAAEARQQEIAAEAAANVAERKAAGEARASREEAQGRADAINLTADAEADRVRKTGTAEAEVERARGEAEAASILARGTAEAEAERKLAEARAAHGGVNKEVEIARIEATARVEVATAYGKAMHEVGKNVTLIQTGGGANGTNPLAGLLGAIPGMFKSLNTENEALNGEPLADTIAELINGVRGRQSKGIISQPAKQVDMPHLNEEELLSEVLATVNDQDSLPVVDNSPEEDSVR